MTAAEEDRQTPSQVWDTHWYRIYKQLQQTPLQPVEAAAMADTQCALKFGPRPTEEDA